MKHETCFTEERLVGTGVIGRGAGVGGLSGSREEKRGRRTKPAGHGWGRKAAAMIPLILLHGRKASVAAGRVLFM